ncbi:hypothetical protein BASA50_006645 [Batrachochytrium salamandrivorans]|uniref:Vacuolar-sorting protein SNF8 n=1 Tax=Batrachochytrium salamandrivorans TaxID=1357716 RepID=A0ABQ8FAI1_9FUNG|nr:hypothetical protein BASA62_000249 [Batrachochytrium salamandrivorans]KAH6560381.1 hypothetical protein BASA60_000302 [Batrachochytrium salamandrivorans]KAH6578340.1 hypothetical protein BASA61_000332 [Batrachochytrium salamandrivorans]KAH6594398.1 hypothetical protein BASA50_006645 [Batrachochytrium salamandrivorans]KAH9252172.1 hypothetical protein BASA81_009923 [Batrachochytrium salamandrivorans]
MSHRRVGIHGLQQQARSKEGFQKAGEALATQQLEQMKDLLDKFKSNLEEFATKHKNDIKRDPVFRMHFQRMCNNLGVDPLASNKGFWSDILGFGDFYYELGIQIAEVCLATRERNGGLIDLDELASQIMKMRGKNAQAISRDDILRSIKTLKPLGNGFDVVTIGSRSMVQSVPRELNADSSKVLALAETDGYFSAEVIKSKLGWEEERITKILQNMLKDGICWIDTQDTNPTYWVAGFFS